jgi:putative ABC transport system substrate-binding protein
MFRRDFMALLGGAAVVGTLPALAQHAVPVVGFVYAGATSSEPDAFVMAFRQGLREGGFVDGQNVAVEYHYSGGRDGELPMLVADLVHRPVAAIVGNTLLAMAAKKITSTLPIVFATGADPVKLGLVASFNRPGGNATGVSFMSAAMEPKRLGVLQELLPRIKVIAALVDPSFPTSADQLSDLQNAASGLGWQIRIFRATTERELDDAFAYMAQQPPDALTVSAVPFFAAQLNQIVGLAARYSVPTMYPIRQFPAAGGLVSYGDSISDAFRIAGVYTSRILKGEKPADLPVLQPTKFELVINTKTAKALGLEVPDRLLALADELIE